MTVLSILPCICSRFCQADSACDHTPRFQVHVDVAEPEIHQSVEACASHLGPLVVRLSAWAREQHLVNADLTVLAIAPPPQESRPRWQSHPRYVQTSGFVFAAMQVGA
jgi:hypothetical protein